MTSSRRSTGILLLNMGTPKAPTTAAVRDYLAEFLSDRRIVDLSPWVWKPVLHGVILRTRPAKSAAKYQRIWTQQGSPMLVHCAALCEAVQEQLDEQSPVQFTVGYAMRYGYPGIAWVLDEWQVAGLERVLVVPLFPQYSSTTAGSAFDAVYAWAGQQVFIPEMRFISDYHDSSGYIKALEQQVLSHWLQNGRAQRLVMSFHGVPQALTNAGDPYHAQCLQTASLLAQALHLQSSDYEVTFQSRFGKGKWLEPSTQATLCALAQQGVKSVDVICPGFSVDCLETLEEIDIEYRQTFLSNGGTAFQYIPCLNAQAPWVSALTGLIQQHVQGWS